MSRDAVRRADGERGFLLVWFSGVIVALFVIAALVIDVLHAYAVVQQVQRAADAAAMAGVVEMPDADAAIARARDVGDDNGAAITAAPGASPNQLTATATRDVETWFGRFAGSHVFTATRSATAEYDPPVAMGSPLNTFGRVAAECAGSCPADTPLWATVSGPLNAKPEGNAAMAGYCDSSGAPFAGFGAYVGSTDNCPNDDADVGTPPLPNADRETTAGWSAQYYVVDTTEVPLRVDVFDPVFVDVNRLCNEGQFTQWATGTLPPPFNTFPYPGGARFATGTASPYCTGDSDVRWDAPPAIRNPPPGSTEISIDQAIQTGGYALTTRFEVLAPDDTPLDPTDNAVSLCGTNEYPGYAGIVTALQANGGAAPAGWRQWRQLCGAGVDAGPGRYVLRVTTKPGTQGQNQFAISAYGPSGSRFDDSAVRVYALDRMAFFNNVAAAPTFYLARVLPASVDRELTLSFFDIGDGASTSLQILPAANAVVGGPGGPAYGSLDCTMTDTSQVNGPSPWDFGAPPFGSPTIGVPGCQVNGMVAATYNGQWISMRVRIPRDYWCDFDPVAAPLGCWLRIRLTTAGGYADMNTWVAKLDQGPVRLVD